MVGVEVDSLGVILNSCIEVALLSVGKASVVIEVSLAWLNLNCSCKALNRLIKVASSV